MMRAMVWIRRAAFALGLVLALWATPARAQHTGGSMGGGSFHSSGSHSYSSGSHSYSSSHSYGRSGYYGGGGSGGGGGCDGGAVAGVFVGIFLLWGMVGLAQQYSGGTSAPVAQRMDVTGLRLAIDWRARKFAQAELDRIAAGANTSSPDGLNAMLRQVALALRRSRESWIYAGFADTTPQSPDRAEAYFNQLVEDSKARFHDELVRNQDGSVTTTAAPSRLRAMPDEGEGLVVITLLVAARGNLRDHHDATDAEQIRGWLEGASAIATSRLVAVQIIWSPAAENDRMSSAELEVLYPELKRVRGSTLAGRVYCQYCGAPYPAELLACPQCGGKAAA